MLNKILLNVFIFFGVSYSSLYIKENVIWFEVIHKSARFYWIHQPLTHQPPTTYPTTHGSRTNRPTNPTIIDLPITLCLKDSKIRHSFTDCKHSRKNGKLYFGLLSIWIGSKLYFGLLSIWIRSKSLIEWITFVFIKHLYICWTFDFLQHLWKKR